MRNPVHYIGRPIESLQTMLRTISDIDQSVLPVVPGGQYGASTYASVRSFQESTEADTTGIADLSTWNSIVHSFGKAELQRTPPVIRPAWSSSQSIRPGEKNQHLYLVQGMLTALSLFFPELSRTGLTGLLDSPTQNGLRWVQKAGGLPVTGHLDTATWNQLSGLYRTMIGNGSIERGS